MLFKQSVFGTDIWQLTFKKYCELVRTEPVLNWDCQFFAVISKPNTSLIMAL